MLLVPKRNIEEEGMLIGIKGKAYQILKEENEECLIIDETGSEDYLSAKFIEENYIKIKDEANIEIELLTEEVLSLLVNLRGKEELLKEARELKSLLNDLTTFVNNLKD